MNFLKNQKRNTKKLLLNSSRSFIIAVSGIGTGAGSTHQSILIANFARRLGTRVAICECNFSNSFSNIEKALGYKSIQNNFKFKGVTFFKNIDNGLLNEILAQNFQVVVLDIGKNLPLYRQHFLNADLPIVVTRNSDWQKENIEYFIDTNNEIMMNRIKWLSLYSSNFELSLLKKRFGKNFLTMPFIKDPFSKNTEIDKYLHKLF